MTLTPFQRRIDSKGRINIPQSYWDVIGAKDYDLVYIIDSIDTDGKPVLKLRKTLAPAPTPTCQPNAHYDITLAKCVCNSGYQADMSGNCVIIPPPPPSNILFEEHFDGFGDYSIPIGSQTKDNKMKNIWGIANVMHDVDGYFLRLETPYNGDGNGISALFLTNQSFSDCKVTWKSRIIRYTWTNPTNYAAPWFMQRYTDVTHHYYEYLQRDGDFEVGKKDNLSTDTYLERQLFVGPQPHLIVPVKNVWYTYEWTMKNNTDGTISITLGGNNGPGTAVQNVYNYIDHDETATKGQYYHLPTQQIYSGRLGPYGEDVVADYKDIVVTAL